MLLKKLLLLFLMLSCIPTKQAANKYKVTGKMMAVYPYCGGAYPTEEKMEAIKKPSPFINGKLFIKKGNTNDLKAPVIDSVITNEAGVFEVMLAPGNYYVVKQDKLNRKVYNTYLKKDSNRVDVTKECLDKWIKTPEFTFVVKEGMDTVRHRFNVRCSWDAMPCGVYVGPLPPSAAPQR